MNDTSVKIQSKYHDLLMQSTNEERFLMGISMFETAREIVIASCPNINSELDKKIHLLKRFYSNDFSADQMNKIITHLKELEK